MKPVPMNLSDSDTREVLVVVVRLDKNYWVYELSDGSERGVIMNSNRLRDFYLEIRDAKSCERVTVIDREAP